MAGSGLRRAHPMQSGMDVQSGMRFDGWPPEDPRLPGAMRLALGDGGILSFEIERNFLAQRDRWPRKKRAHWPSRSQGQWQTLLCRWVRHLDRQVPRRGAALNGVRIGVHG